MAAADFFSAGAERRGVEKEEGWCNRAEITVLTSQSVRVSEDETSDRLWRCRRCQKHTYLLCRVLNLLILEVLQDYLSHTATALLYIWGLNVFLLWSNALWKRSSSMVCFMLLHQWLQVCLCGRSMAQLMSCKIIIIQFVSYFCVLFWVESESSLSKNRNTSSM